MGYVVDFGVNATRREHEMYTSAQFCCVLRRPLGLGAVVISCTIFVYRLHRNSLGLVKL
jgi:hypothetical protein